MESSVTQECKKTLAGTQTAANNESVENFQKFIHELFEQNGVINDLRTHLRGHIVNVIRNAKTGEIPACQKRFTQRLELTYQALNILITEYLMRLDFNYSLSMFVSEIPLANMVFGFAKTMMQRRDDDETEIRFKDNDVWSILNYLGVQCDSEHATCIIDMYKNDRESCLLLCILKCLPMYQKDPVGVEEAISPKDLSSAISSDISINKVGKSKNRDPLAPDKCRHIAYCNLCQNHIQRLKDKYRKKKKSLYKSMNPNVKPLKEENLMKSISILERGLIDEMFQQLKSVYETEMEMVKVEEEKKVKRSLVSHTLQLQKQQDQLEESFKEREAELERNVSQKKKFLWGLARALREQHQHMTRAMHDVRLESNRLSAKEDSLKSQLAEAEHILKKRGEEMRQQISEELTILEGHLASMKSERDNINKERSELENSKTIVIANSKVAKIQNFESEQLHTHYDLLKNELAILKKYLETSKLTPKCVIERGTMTELSDVTSNVNVALNNSQIAERSKVDEFDDRLKNQVVNDFKKKNVNFTPSQLDEIYRERSYTRTRTSSGSSEAGDTAHPSDAARDELQRLRQENCRLRTCARQQRCQIETLSRAVARAALQPRAPPAPPPSAPLASTPTASQPRYFLHSVNTSASANTVSVGWRKGAGEELSLFRDAQPRILVPGDSIPFVGVLRDRDRHATTRRQLLSQWRALRARTYPLAGVSKRTPSPIQDRSNNSVHTVILESTEQPSCSLRPDGGHAGHSLRDNSQHQSKCCRNREKSPKSVLREAKEKLRNIKDSSVASRDKSPNAILREAKLRLRKLEIEAEAVEQSYLDFRRRQSGLRLERNKCAIVEDQPSRSTDVVRDLNLTPKHSHSLQKLESASRNEIDVPLTDLQKCIRKDFDKYLREYQTKVDICESHFRTKTSVDMITPIPNVYTEISEEKVHRGDLLEAPLTEFRKLYHTSRQVTDDDGQVSQSTFVKQLESNASEDYERVSLECDDSQSVSPRINRRRSGKHSKTSELEILKRNINKIYNLSNEIIDTDVGEEPPIIEQNLLRVEVESVSGIKADAQDLLLVVQNAIDIREVTISQASSPDNVSGQMTIIVTPRESKPKSGEDIDLDNLDIKSPEKLAQSKRSSSPEQEAHLTRNDVLDAIFHTDTNNQLSSTHVHSNVSKDVLEPSISDFEKRDDYPDDFSADVDNYNSRSESLNSPVSVLKTSEDENFWDI